MTPNYELAATSAIRTLLFHNITSAPVVPLPIVKTTPGVLAMPFSDLANNAGPTVSHPNTRVTIYQIAI